MQIGSGSECSCRQLGRAQEGGDGVRFEAAFRRARAAEAWSRSLGPIDRESAAEALYEAIHAFGGGAQAEAVVTRLIHA